MLLWRTGNWTSYPEDGRAYIEKGAKLWWVYKTEDGHVVVPDFPKLTETGFEAVEDAQVWVEENVTRRRPQ